MAATLEDIEAALLAALQALKTTATPTAGPFVMVDRWAGEVTAGDDIDEATLGKSPSALLAFERSMPEGADGVHSQTNGHDLQVVERHYFRVYVTVRDTRSTKAGQVGTTGQPGALRCARLVKEALAGLEIPGLFDGETVHLIEHLPWRIQPGTQYTHIVRVSARAELPESIPALPGVPLSRMDTSVTDSAPDTDDAAVVIATSRATRP